MPGNPTKSSGLALPGTQLFGWLGRRRKAVRVLRAQRQGTLRDVSRWKLAALGTPSPEEIFFVWGCGELLRNFTCNFMASNIIKLWWCLGSLYSCLFLFLLEVQDDPDGKLKQQAWNSLQFLGDKMTLPETNIKTPEHRKIPWKRRFLLKTHHF